MRHVTSTLAAFTLASAVSVFAQEPAPAPAPAPSSQQAPQEQPASKEQTTPKSTLTGCVVQAKTTDGGTAFVLSKAEGGSATMYVLAGPTESEFSKNVNKKVEVMGPVQTPPSADPSQPADPNVVRPPLIVVESVKVVAESCS